MTSVDSNRLVLYITFTPLATTMQTRRTKHGTLIDLKKVSNKHLGIISDPLKINVHLCLRRNKLRNNVFFNFKAGINQTASFFK